MARCLCATVALEVRGSNVDERRASNGDSVSELGGGGGEDSVGLAEGTNSAAGAGDGAGDGLCVRVGGGLDDDGAGNGGPGDVDASVGEGEVAWDGEGDLLVLEVHVLAGDSEGGEGRDTEVGVVRGALLDEAGGQGVDLVEVERGVV